MKIILTTIQNITSSRIRHFKMLIHARRCPFVQSRADRITHLLTSSILSIQTKYVSIKTLSKKNNLFLLSSVFFTTLSAQPHASFVDSIRKAYHIPEIVYARISSGRIYEMKALGITKLNSTHTASLNDKFRIGSNTKSVTAFIAALLVKEGKLKWDTRFFDLFPELKANSDPAHHSLTLLNLLSMRTHLYSYSYYYEKPEQTDFTGDEAQQRYQFLSWCLKQPAVSDSARTDNTDSIHFSNLGYVAAGLMMEKASGKSYKQLVEELGNKLGITFQFGQPNTTDSLQPWGHNKDLIPEPPGDNYKLNWLLAAGNINVSLPDYIKFIQLQLKGLKGESNLLSAEEFNFLHYGLPEVSLGWFWGTDEQGNRWSTHTGNPGSFLTQVTLCKERDFATLVFMNVQTPDSEKAMEIITDQLTKK